jgi:2-polyprenyl-3-methyl-5-hydroxy-6-metoxy-1,4-benzoquinol methylase
MKARRFARDPDREIGSGNPWYVEDQFLIQLGSPALRLVVENRWQLFERAIDDWSRSKGGIAPARLLDAGCGDGINLSFLARMVANRGWPTVLIAADYNSLRLDRARIQRVSAIVRASVTQLAFKDNAFDIVICNQVLEHVPDDTVALRELRRVLQPGGLLIVGVPNEGSHLGILRNHVLQRSILRSTDHVNFYTRRTLLGRLQAAGLHVVRVEPEGFFTPHTILHSALNRWRVITSLLNAIARAVPAWAAGLQVVATRPQGVRSDVRH